MKNVAILIPSLKSGGAEKQASLLACSLSKRYEVFLIVFYGDMIISEANANILNSTAAIHIEKLEGNLFQKSLHLYRFYKKNSIDVAFNYLTLPDVYGCIIGRVAGVRCIYNGIRNSRLPFLKFVIEKICHNYFATGTIFNCYSGAEHFISKGYRKSKSIVIPNCYPNIEEPIKRNDGAVVHIITIGRFVAQKDFETAIRTISILKEKNIHYTIVGYGELENCIRKWAECYGINHITTIHINPNNTQDLLRNSDIYLSTSLFEGTSNSIMEAMNWSLPVVATNVGDNKYLIHECKNGFIRPVRDAVGLSHSIENLLNDITLRNTMGIKGNHILQERYSLEIFEKKYIDLIER